MARPKAVRTPPAAPPKLWVRIHIGGAITLMTDRAEAERWFQGGVTVHEYDLTRTHKSTEGST